MDNRTNEEIKNNIISIHRKITESLNALVIKPIENSSTDLIAQIIRENQTARETELLIEGN